MSWRSIAEQYYARIAELDHMNGLMRDHAGEMKARIAELEATLAQERRTYASVAEQLKARIAELEAEVARLNTVVAHEIRRSAEEVGRIGAERDNAVAAYSEMKLAYDDIFSQLRKQRSWEGAAHEYEEQARFARAERDRLKAALEPFARAYDAIKRDHPDWLTMDFISDYFTPSEFYAARAALSGEGVT